MCNFCNNVTIRVGGAYNTKTASGRHRQEEEEEVAQTGKVHTFLSTFAVDLASHYSFM